VKPLQRILVGSEPETAEDRQRRQDETVRRLREALEVKAIVGGLMARGRQAAVSKMARQVVSDGVWTWYNNPQARYRNGATYLGYNTQAGTLRMSKIVHETGVVTSATVQTGASVDDHAVPTFDFLPDGRIVVAYSFFNDAYLRIRVSSSAEDITAWESEQAILMPSSQLTAYASTHYLSGPGRVYVFNRRYGSTKRVNEYRHSASGSSWSSGQEFYAGSESNSRAYVISRALGGAQIHFLASAKHPDSANSKIVHFYGAWDGVNDALKWYKTDGTEITASLPFNETHATQVFDGGSQRAWNWDINFDSFGRPRAVFTKYPNGDGTDIRMMFSRWNGSAWTTPVDIVGASVGTGLYTAEPFYTGGAAFDDGDVNTVYLCRESIAAGRYELERWTTSDDGATWSFQQRYTATATGDDALRPVSPRGHNGRVGLLWVEGDYNAFTDFATAIRGFY
jgi:hypothetical protein